MYCVRVPVCVCTLVCNCFGYESSHRMMFLQQVSSQNTPWTRVELYSLFIVNTVFTILLLPTTAVLSRKTAFSFSREHTTRECKKKEGRRRLLFLLQNPCVWQRYRPVRTTWYHIIHRISGYSISVCGELLHHSSERWLNYRGRVLNVGERKM